jgi:hypothetical protein
VEQPHLDRGDDAEVAAAAAQRPEEVGVLARGRPHEAAVGEHHLDRRDGVGGQAVLAADPAEAAAERVAHDPDVRRRAERRHEAGALELRGDVEPHHAGLGAEGAAVDVDVDAPHLVQLHEHGPVERAERSSVVTGALRRDAQPALAGEGDGGLDVRHRAGHDDGGGTLVDVEVPGVAGGVPAGVGGSDGGAGQAGVEGPEV